MKPFWHPLAALCVPELGVYASPALIRMMLGGEGGATLLYAGDRMGLAKEEPFPVRVEPCSAEELKPGDVVVASVSGIPDLLRVVRRETDGRLVVQGDCDPRERSAVEAQALLARACLPNRRVSGLARRLRRLRVDLAEARLRGPDDEAAEDRARSVLDKYDTQAAFYSAGEPQSVGTALLARLRRRVPPPGPLLVVGSGSGGECFSLARAGYRVRGIDFAPRMIEHARRGAAQRGLEIEFLQADILRHREPRDSLGGVLFTADVFSFLPERPARERLLRGLADWLTPSGAVFLSARRLRRSYERAILLLQWCSRAGRSWGDSHTRYLTPDGSLRRSFVHYFSSRRLEAELRRAGFRLDGWTEGHAELSVAPE